MFGCSDVLMFGCSDVRMFGCSFWCVRCSALCVVVFSVFLWWQYKELVRPFTDRAWDNSTGGDGGGMYCVTGADDSGCKV